MNVLAVFMGAGIGGALRYLLGGWMLERWGSGFPWHTFVINVSGALLLGLLAAFALERELLPENLTLFLTVGLLGGFTTFSTLSWESLELIQTGHSLAGFANMFGSGAAGLLAAAIGLAIGRAI